VARKIRKCLVIDASVVRSASFADDPVASKCWECLETIYVTCHKAILTADIEREWYDVALLPASGSAVRTTYITGWLAAMEARGKLLRQNIPRNSDLRRKINRIGLDPNDRMELIADIHLIEAAVATDKTVLSRDDAARRILTTAVRYFPELGPIVWCNPVTQHPGVIDWMKTGAKTVRAWQLRSRIDKR
jgi:hypothetical protein